MDLKRNNNWQSEKQKEASISTELKALRHQHTQDKETIQELAKALEDSYSFIAELDHTIKGVNILIKISEVLLKITK